MESPDGEVTVTTPAETGTVVCGSEGNVHLPTNTSGADLELLLVEFKGAMAGSEAMPEAPHAVTADPDHYSVEFENDAARIVRVDYGPGESSVMHHHPAYCAVTIVQGVGTTFELADGTVEDAPGGELGALNCVDAEVHSPTNTEGDLKAVLIEFKGRSTAG